jgi:hypothetical protein
MFATGNQQLLASSFHTDIALILAFSQGEKEPLVRSAKAYRSSLSLRERAGVRVACVLM